jgi:hypothetical protein
LLSYIEGKRRRYNVSILVLVISYVKRGIGLAATVLFVLLVDYVF